MAIREDLVFFTREALSAGRSRAEIDTALQEAGWSATEAKEALSAFAETAFVPPVPRPRAIVSARDFLVYMLMFGAMLTSAITLTFLSFAVIDLMLDDNVSSYIFRQMRDMIAFLIVSIPVFGWLHYKERNRLAASPGRRRSSIRKWIASFALLLAAATFLGDLVVALQRLLNGDASLEFVLRVLTVAVISGGVFQFYRSDLGDEGDA